MLRSILILVFGLPVFSCLAQDYAEYLWTFDPTLGVSQVEPVDGGYLMCGSALASNFDSTIAILLKTDLDLNIEWAKRYKALNKDDFSVITSLADGNFLVGGATRQNFNPESGAQVYKLDAEGTMIWAKGYAESGDYRVLGMFEEPDGNLMIFIRYGVNNQPTIILYTTSEGEVISQRACYYDNWALHGDEVMSIGEGKYVVLGSRLDGYIGHRVLQMASVTNNEVLWYQELNLGRGAAAYAISQSAPDELLVAGYIDHESNELLDNAFVLKMDTAAVVSQAAEIPLELVSQFVSDVQQAASGEVMMVGSANDFELGKGVFYKVSEDFSEVVSGQYFPGEVFQGMNDILLRDNGELLLKGGSYNGPIFAFTDANGQSDCSQAWDGFSTGSLDVESASYPVDIVDPELTTYTPDVEISDVFIASSQTCATSIEETDGALYALPYPNPVVSTLTVSGIRDEIISLRVLDPVGRDMGSSDWDQSLEEVSIRGLERLPSGPYHLLLTTEINTLHFQFLRR